MTSLFYTKIYYWIKCRESIEMGLCRYNCVKFTVIRDP